MAAATYLFYTHSLSGGGAERVFAMLASGFARSGCRVIFAVDFEDDANRDLLDAEIECVVLGRNHALSTIRLAGLIAREKPDATFSALAASNLKHAIAANLALRARHAVTSWHGYAVSEPQRLSRMGFRFARLIAMTTARTLCVSDGLMAYMVNSCGVPPAHAKRIYNPVLASPSPARSAAELAARAPHIVACGRLVSYKNFGLLLRAFSLLSNRDAHLTILGEGPARADLERQAAELGLGDRVAFPGFAATPWDAFSHARVFALPSTSESFGLVVAEALSSGLPVVASDCDGPREILRDGALGTLIAGDDAPAFAAALQAALDAPGDPAPRIARANEFSVEVGVANWLHVAQRVARNGRKTPGWLARWRRHLATIARMAHL